MRIIHHDKLELRFDRSSKRTNADGSLTIDGFGAHVGPYTYHDDKGQPFIEQVPASTLFEPASLDSAAGSTLTIRHGPGLVGPDQYRAEAHGSWVKAWDAGDGNLGVRLRVSSREGLEFVNGAVSKGVAVELSPVYEVDIAERPTADGGRELVQESRRYSGIALLGPNEARGGPSAKLNLDGPACAPEGSRVEVRGPRLDNAADPRLSFVAKARDHMKTATITSKGRTRAVSLDALNHLRAIPHGDQIETGTITIAIEGEETSELVLPVSMIEALLEGIGATSAPAEAPAAPEEDVALEALDADEDEKMDAKTVRKMIADAIDSERRRVVSQDARRSSINADAASLLPAGYDYSVAWTQVALDAIVRARPDLEAQAKKLAVGATSDAEAAGQLRQMLTERRLERDSSSSVRLANTQVNEDATPPWASETMPKNEVEQ